MKRLFIFLATLFVVLSGPVISPAAPIPAIGPMHIEGVIEALSWTPDIFIGSSLFQVGNGMSSVYCAFAILSASHERP